jgi:hypothetical protein
MVISETAITTHLFTHFAQNHATIIMCKTDDNNIHPYGTNPKNFPEKFFQERPTQKQGVPPPENSLTTLIEKPMDN